MPCHSESLLSLRIGLQATLWALGGVPEQLQTDHSSTATHVLDRTSKERGFNTGYLALCGHYGLEPTTIHVACPNEQGDIESAIDDGNLRSSVSPAGHSSQSCSYAHLPNGSGGGGALARPSPQPLPKIFLFPEGRWLRPLPSDPSPSPTLRVGF